MRILICCTDFKIEINHLRFDSHRVIVYCHASESWHDKNALMVVLKNMTNALHAALKEKKIHLSRLGLSWLRNHDNVHNKRFLKPIEFEELLFDFSKNLLDQETFELLLAWAKAEKLLEEIQRLYCGFPVNQSEQRAALHMALRGGCKPDFTMDGQSIPILVSTELNKMRVFVESLQNNSLVGFTGKPIETLVNLGVGGSDLGVVLCLDALQEYNNPNLQTYCVSSLGGIYLKKLLQQLNPETTLFIISSKSFSTIDTLTNANTARKWFEKKTESSGVWQKHFVGISANQAAMEHYGILPEKQFYLWDWVGGRYSISSAIGLPVAASIGMDRFFEFLEGMRLADEHFFKTSFDRNVPVLMGLLAIWYANFWASEAHVILPYDERLKKLPVYLAQLLVESLGKRVRQDGTAVTTHTSPIVFGEIGTNAQHTFFQMLHQGTRFVTADFIAVAQSNVHDCQQHRLSLANCLAQSQALAFGFTREEVAAELKQKGYAESEIKHLLPHKVHPGNRPSNTFLLQRLTPKTLGMLIALYEHKVFVQSVLWGVNPFDQWGVELGKATADKLLHFVGHKTTQFDFSTNQLLNYIARE